MEVLVRYAAVKDEGVAILFFGGMAWTMVCTNLVKIQKGCCAFSDEKMEVETCSCCADRCGMARERTVLLVRS